MDASLTRREVMRRGLIAGTGPLLAGGLSLEALAAESPATAPTRPRPRGTAKSVIQIWANGGPSQVDTFDPKPGAGADYTGPLDEAIETSVPGIRINAALPLMAKQADKYAIIRSVTHEQRRHEYSGTIALTGRNPRGPHEFPSYGCVVSALKGYDAGYRGKVPPYVLLTHNQSLPCYKTGFLDRKHAPFVTGGDPSKTPFVVEGIVTEGISDTRQQQRREFLASIDTLGQAMKDAPQAELLRKARAEAYDMIMGEGRKIFDPSSEPDALRSRYGRSKFGQSCLVARKLVEAGVPFVEINDCDHPDPRNPAKTVNWDTHTNHFDLMKTMLPTLDQGLSALLQDLADRRLLDSTVIVWGAEMGRSPKVDTSKNSGRDHWPMCYSMVLAGGGFKGGCVVGQSDARGEYVKQRPVYPGDIIGSIYLLLGIGLDTLIPHSRLRFPVVAAPQENVPSAGVLTEIM